MSEEEKKAIEFMEEYKDVVYKIPFKTILNLINKQQKEIEELQQIVRQYKEIAPDRTSTVSERNL